MKARGASVVAVATDDDDQIEAVADFVLRVPATEPMFTPMVDVVRCSCSPTPWRADSVATSTARATSPRP